MPRFSSQQMASFITEIDYKPIQIASKTVVETPGHITPIYVRLYPIGSQTTITWLSVIEVKPPLIEMDDEIAPTV